MKYYFQLGSSVSSSPLWFVGWCFKQQMNFNHLHLVTLFVINSLIILVIFSSHEYFTYNLVLILFRVSLRWSALAQNIITVSPLFSIQPPSPLVSPQCRSRKEKKESSPLKGVILFIKKQMYFNMEVKALSKNVLWRKTCSFSWKLVQLSVSIIYLYYYELICNI